MHAGELDRRTVHLDLGKAQHQRVPRLKAAAVDAAVLGELVFREDHQSEIAEAIGITPPKRAAQLAPIVPGHLLHHDEIGIGLGEKLGDLVDPVVLVPDIEGDHPEEARGAGRRLLRPALQALREMDAVDDREQCREHRQHAAPRERGEDQQKDRAGQKKGKPVIDDVERWEPPREQSEQGCDRADDESGEGKRLHDD